MLHVDPTKDERFRAWHLSVTCNRKRIEQAGRAHCGFCCHTIQAEHVVWIKEHPDLLKVNCQETGLCPRCRTDCLIPDEFNIKREDLIKFHDEYFEGIPLSEIEEDLRKEEDDE